MEPCGTPYVIILSSGRSYCITLDSAFKYTDLLKKIVGAKLGGRRNLRNEELHNLYCSPSIIRIIKSRRMRWAGHVARTGEKRNAYRFLVGKPKGNRSLGRPRRRWEDNSKMDRMGWYGLD
jgi:hypothetical protein